MKIEEFYDVMLKKINNNFRTNFSYSETTTDEDMNTVPNPVFENDPITLDTELWEINAEDSEWFVLLCINMGLENLPAGIAHSNAPLRELLDMLYYNNY